MRNYNINTTNTEALRLLKESEIKRSLEIYNFVNVYNSIDGPKKIFIDGDWGSGKSVFSKQLQLIFENNRRSKTYKNTVDNDEYLKKLNLTKRFITVYFNAWENDYFSDPLVGIFLTVLSVIEDFTNKIKDEKRSKAVKAAASELLKNIMEASEFKVGPLSVNLGMLHGAYEQGRKAYENVGELLNRFKEVESLRKTIDEGLTEVYKKTKKDIIIFIDELDRCRPEYAIDLLEQTKNLFQNIHFHIIYVVNTNELSKSMQGIYGTNFDGSSYLSKFYDWKYVLQTVNINSYIKSLNKSNINMDTEEFIVEMCNNYNISLRKINSIISELDELLGKIPEAMLENLPDIIKNYLLPALIILKHFDYERYVLVTKNIDNDNYYEFLKVSQRFAHVFNKYKSIPLTYTEGDKKILASYDGPTLIQDCLSLWYCSKSSKSLIDSVARINKFIGPKFQSNIGYSIEQLRDYFI